MKTRATLAVLLGAALLVLAGPAGAETLYRILVDGQGEVVTSTAPVTAGSMILVRRADGSLRAIPSNLVSSVTTAKKAPSTATSLATSLSSIRLVNAAGSKPVSIDGGRRLSGSLAITKAGSSAAGSSGRTFSTTLTSAMRPGQTLFIGQTGGGVTTSIAANRARSASIDTIVVSPRVGSAATAARQAAMGIAIAPSANPLAASIERQIFQSDLTRDSAQPGVTVENGDFIMGANGFPVPFTAETTPTAQTVIGPNGFPVPITTAQTAPQTVAPVIGPNGFPVPATTAQTGSGITAPVTAPNGFPATGATATSAGIAAPATAPASTGTATTSSGSPQ